MKSNSRSLALSDEGYEALRSLEKNLPFLKRGKLVSLALVNIQRVFWGEEPIILACERTLRTPHKEDAK